MGRGNQKGGKKHKRGKKNISDTSSLRLKENGQEYAQVSGCKGNCRFDVKCFDGKDRLGILCGSMRKRKFINTEDIVLVSIRDFQDDKCDIIDVYNESHVYTLKKDKHIPELTQKIEENNFYENYDIDIDIDFDDNDSILDGEDEKEIDIDDI